MKLWYFSLSPLNQALQVAEKATRRFAGWEITVFVPGKENRILPCSRCRLESFHCGDSLARKAMGNAFALSYEIKQAIQNAAVRGLPDAIVLPLQNAAAYYTVLDSWLNPDFYVSCPIYVLETEKAIFPHPPHYLLPFWWIQQQENWCRKAARAVLTEADLPDFADRVLRDQSKKLPKSYPLQTERPQAPIPDSVDAGIPGLLSVIVPFYNLGRFLPQALESVFSIDYPNYEVILIDDGSTDATSLEVLVQMQTRYPALQVFRQQNTGLSAVRNLGSHLAKGEFITFVDADDMVDSTYYTQAIALLNRYKNVAYISSWMRLFGEVDGVKAYFASSLPILLLDNTQCHACIIRKNVFLAFGQNSPEMRNGMEDHDFWINLADYGYFSINIPEPYYHYRISAGSMSASFGRDATRYRQTSLYELLESRHPALFQTYSSEIFNLLNANGPAYLWPGPASYHASVMYNDHMRREWELTRQHVENIENSRLYRFIKRLRGNR